MHAQAKADMGAILFNCTQPKHQGLMAELCAAKVLAPWSPELAYTGDVGDGREPASPAGTYVPLDGTNGIVPCGCTKHTAQRGNLLPRRRMHGLCSGSRARCCA